MKKCVYCDSELTGRKLKYCNDLCKFRFQSIQNDKVRPLSISQHLRMARAGKAQRKGKIGCRYN